MRLRITFSSKGQSSLEYMVMLALALGIFTVILVATTHLISASSSQIGVESAQRAVTDIKEAADFVYVHGHPSKLRIKVYIPPSIYETSIDATSNKVIRLRLDSTPDYTDVYAVTRGNITGDLSSLNREGYYVLKVESIDNFWANITRVTSQ